MFSVITNKWMKIVVNGLGAELTSIQSSDGLEYLWQPDPDYWKRQSPHLFPIVGSLPGNHYRFDGQEYELETHGFVKDCQFELVKSSSERLDYRLTENERTLVKYPFQFDFEVSYVLYTNTLQILYSVTNTDSKRMWFSLGAHPGFCCPMEPGDTLKDYYLEFDRNERAKRYLLENNLRTGEQEIFLDNEKIVPLSYELFQRGAIVLKDLKSKSVTLRNRKNQRQITVKFADFPYLGIWSAPGPFVCIEPWYGVSSRNSSNIEFRGKEGILDLNPGERFTCYYQIIFQ